MAGRKKAEADLPEMGKFFNKKLTGYSCGYGLIDRVSGVPGILFPNAVAVELYGQKSSGKTTLVLETIAYNQLINPKFKVLYMDYEKMLRAEIPYLNSLGITVDDEKFIIKDDMTTAEEGMDFMIDAIKNDNFDMIIVDTVAAMVPKAEQESKIGDSKQMGLRAKLMNEFLRKFFSLCPPDGPSLIFLNQQYKDMNSISYVQTYHTPSSDGLAYYAGIKILVKEKQKLKRDIMDPYTLEKIAQPYGSVIEIKTEKNKVGRPFVSSKYFITYGSGIDIIPSLVNAAVASKVIKASTGGVHKFNNVNGEEVTVRGYANVLDYFAEHLDDLVNIGKQINPLWAKDMAHLKERLEAKHPLQDSMFEDMYSIDDSDGAVQADMSEILAPVDEEGKSKEGSVTLESLDGEITSDGLKIL